MLFWSSLSIFYVDVLTVLSLFSEVIHFGVCYWSSEFHLGS